MGLSSFSLFPSMFFSSLTYSESKSFDKWLNAKNKKKKKITITDNVSKRRKVLMLCLIFNIDFTLSRGKKV